MDIEVGLRGPTPGIDLPSSGGQVTALWLQMSEMEFVGCDGHSLASSGFETGDNLTMRQRIDVVAPDTPICAIVVRTSPLDPSLSPLPSSSYAGQGAVVEGQDATGIPFSALISQRITSILIPTSDVLTLGEAETLQLNIDDGQLLGPVSVYGAMTPAMEPSVYDSATTPTLVDDLANELNLAFSLERGTGLEAEVLAQSTATWSSIDDLLCASECDLQDRTACSDVACDVQECINQLSDPACGESFRNALHCRVGMNPEEYSCVNNTLSVVDSHCALPQSTYGSCGGT